LEQVQSRGANIFFILFPLFWGTYFGYLFWNDINQNLQQNNQQPIATIEQVAKSVQRQYASRNLWESANESLALYSGDKIIIGSGAAVRIAITTGDVIELGPNSLIALLFTKDGNGVISLESGTLVSVVSTGRLLMQSGDGPTKPIEPESVYDSLGETAVASSFGELFSSTALTPLIVVTELPVEQLAPSVEVIEAPALVRLRLPVPVNLLPFQNSVITKGELAGLQGMRFSWDPVPEADSYIWTLGRSNGAVLHRASVRSTSYVLTDVSLFTMSQDFVWTVQAQRAAPYNDKFCRGKRFAYSFAAY
jgi:hypothetical protein